MHFKVKKESKAKMPRALSAQSGKGAGKNFLTTKEEAAAETWLREQVFDPELGLCQVPSGATALFGACEGGELGVCKGGHGAASTTRAKVNDGWTPMHSVWPTVTARGLAAAIIAVETLVSDLARIPSLS